MSFGLLEACRVICSEGDAICNNGNRINNKVRNWTMKTRKTKLFLYIIMLFCIIINSSTTELTGINIHIISGITFYFLSWLHILINRHYFMTVCKNYFKVSMKTKINIIIDFCLIILYTLIVITGILLYKDIYPSVFKERHDFETFHGVIAATAFVLMIVHIIFHIKIKKRPPRYTKLK